MTDGLSDDLPPEILAAYADGELSPRDRDRVDQWLADHPEGRELLDEQESFGARNVEFWHAVRPPEPSRYQWENVLHAVRGRARVPVSRRWLPWVGSLAAAATATAATVLLALPSVNQPAARGPADPPAAIPQPAVAGDEPAYTALHRSLGNYDKALHERKGAE